MDRLTETGRGGEERERLSPDLRLRERGEGETESQGLFDVEPRGGSAGQPSRGQPQPGRESTSVLADLLDRMRLAVQGHVCFACTSGYGCAVTARERERRRGWWPVGGKFPLGMGLGFEGER